MGHTIFLRELQAPQLQRNYYDREIGAREGGFVPRSLFTEQVITSFF